MTSPTQRSPWSIVLPWPPSNNHYYAVAHGRKILSKQGRRYAGDVFAAVHEQPEPDTWLFKSARLCVRITTWQPTRQNCDLDNFLKAPLDSLGKAGIYDDDSQIDRLGIIRGPVLKPGGLWIELYESCYDAIEIPAAVRREAL